MPEHGTGDLGQVRQPCGGLKRTRDYAACTERNAIRPKPAAAAVQNDSTKACYYSVESNEDHVAHGVVCDSHKAINPSWLEMPEELLARVFLHLLDTDDGLMHVRKAGTVCRGWHAVAQETILRDTAASRPHRAPMQAKSVTKAPQAPKTCVAALVQSRDVGSSEVCSPSIANRPSARAASGAKFTCNIPQLRGHVAALEHGRRASMAAPPRVGAAPAAGLTGRRGPGMRGMGGHVLSASGSVAPSRLLPAVLSLGTPIMTVRTLPDTVSGSEMVGPRQDVAEHDPGLAAVVAEVHPMEAQSASGGLHSPQTSAQNPARTLRHPLEGRRCAAETVHADSVRGTIAGHGDGERSVSTGGTAVSWSGMLQSALVWLGWPGSRRRSS